MFKLLLAAARASLAAQSSIALAILKTQAAAHTGILYTLSERAFHTYI